MGKNLKNIIINDEVVVIVETHEEHKVIFGIKSSLNHQGKTIWFKPDTMRAIIEATKSYVDLSEVLFNERDGKDTL